MNKIIGFYGGKFIPMHLGHEYCIKVACSMCDEVHIILFDSPENRPLEHNTCIDEYLTIENRLAQLEKIKRKYESRDKKIVIHYINTDSCVFEDGSENWDAETPLVMQAIGKKFDYVYSSELSYDAYFKRAYPWAKHILVDPPRRKFPISGTEIREGGKEILDKWSV